MSEEVIIFSSSTNIYLGEEGNMDDKEKASLTLSPKEGAGHYGNLIKGYSIKNSNNNNKNKKKPNTNNFEE